MVSLLLLCSRIPCLGKPESNPLALDESAPGEHAGTVSPSLVSSPECVSVIAHVSPLLILLVERCFLAEGSCNDRRLFKVTASIRRRKEQRTANIDPLSVIHRAGR